MLNPRTASSSSSSKIRLPPRWTRHSWRCQPRYASPSCPLLEAVHVPHSPVGEEPEGAGSEEDSEAGTDVPRAAPTQVSALAQRPNPWTPRAAAELGLFVDEPVDEGAAGPAAEATKWSQFPPPSHHSSAFAPPPRQSVFMHLPIWCSTVEWTLCAAASPASEAYAPPSGQQHSPPAPAAGSPECEMDPTG
ncbi:hypothetical protein FS749_002188 [Ceratobasidium sp. UAMH 11750]|nr:hypothetical protein FS749_002188 [Ceratobasidium sp. UAMH 11750]